MKTQTALITGCNSGIGKITAIELAKQDYEIIMLVRESQKSYQAFEEIKMFSPKIKVHLYFADLSSLESISKVCSKINNEFEKIDVLINNAGVYKRNYEESEDGFEMTLAVNYLAAFGLTLQFLPLLRKSENARIINLTSELYKRADKDIESLFGSKKFNGDKVYANSKYLINYFTKGLSKRLEKDAISVNCVHPGVVATDVFREYPKWFAKMLNVIISKPEEGAKPSIYLASSEEVKNLSGYYFKKLKKQALSEIADNDALARQIWVKSLEITKLEEAL